MIENIITQQWHVLLAIIAGARGYQVLQSDAKSASKDQAETRAELTRMQSRVDTVTEVQQKREVHMVKIEGVLELIDQKISTFILQTNKDTTAIAEQLKDLQRTVAK